VHVFFVIIVIITVVVVVAVVCPNHWTGLTPRLSLGDDSIIMRIEKSN
jgi:hypothetical protein